MPNSEFGLLIITGDITKFISFKRLRNQRCEKQFDMLFPSGEFFCLFYEE